MLEAMQAFYETSYANVHRGVYQLAERATEGLERAREKVRALLNAPAAREIVFVRNTEAINLVAYAHGLATLGPGDIVVVTELEHHSNYVPWQYVARRTGAGFRMIPLDDNGELLDTLDELASEGSAKIVATGVVSNSLGTVNPVERLAAWAHEQGAVMVADAARRRRTGAWTCRRSAATSRPSPPTRCAARAVSALWDGPSCSNRWSRSSPEGT